MISALITLVAAALLVVIDQGIKLWATASLAAGGQHAADPRRGGAALFFERRGGLQHSGGSRAF